MALCTQNLLEVQLLYQRVAVLERGRLLALGSPEGLARELVRELQVELELAPEDGAAVSALREVPGMVPPEAMAGVEGFLDRVPERLRAELAGLDGSQKLTVLALVYFLVPCTCSPL